MANQTNNKSYNKYKSINFKVRCYANSIRHEYILNMSTCIYKHAKGHVCYIIHVHVTIYTGNMFNVNVNMNVMQI